MPKLMNASASIVGATVSNFGFSAKRADDLTATEYTLADIAVDVSPSTSPFLADLQKGLQVVVDSLKKSPRAENMLVRVQTFSSRIDEVHGFINLSDIDAASYNLTVTGGGTALNDAALAGVEAVEAEGARLDSLDYGVNAVIFNITDGQDSGASHVVRVGNEKKIKEAINRARQAEKLESLKAILIGVGTPDANDPTQPDSSTKQYLEDFAQRAGYDQFVWIGAATAGNIAKLAQFVSKSVSSSSQALGTGGASQNLSF